jgi:hypothetical protein
MSAVRMQPVASLLVEGGDDKDDPGAAGELIGLTRKELL